MSNINPRRRLFLVAASGVAGFFLLLLALLIFIIVSFAAIGFPFGGGSPSLIENLILFGLVPLIISLAASLPAWALGTKLWQGFFIGVAAMGIFVLIEYIAGRISPYGLLSRSETLAFIAAILSVVLTVTVNIYKLSLRMILVLLALGEFLIVLRFILPNETISGGVTALMAWILMPLTVEFATNEK